MPNWSQLVSTVFLLFQYTASNPLTTVDPNERHGEKPYHLEVRDDFADKWLGINWKLAQQECSEAKLEQLKIAFSDAVLLARTASNSEITWDGPFTWLFGKGWEDSVGDRDYVEDVWGNIKAAANYPVYGDPRGSKYYKPIHQLTVRCGQTGTGQRCGTSGSASSGKVLAYSNAQRAGEGAQMTVCPEFFNVNTIAQLERRGFRSSLGDYVTTGHVVLHEFMHNRRFGYCNEINDLWSVLPWSKGASVEIYGLSRCKDFAELGGPRVPNIKTVSNADSYAWWATGVYWNRVYNPRIGPRPRRMRLRRDEGPTWLNGDDSANPYNGYTYADENKVDAATFTQPAPTDLPQCKIDRTNPKEPRMKCDGQTNESLEDTKKSLSQVLGLTSSTPATPTVAPTPPTYATGWCGMHITQYQKNRDTGPNGMSPDFMLDISFFDGKQKPISIKNCNGCGNKARSIALPGKKNEIATGLPYLMQVTVGSLDNDAVLFEYAGQKWGSNDQPHHSDFGGYKDGMRQGDTGFAC